MNNQNSKEDNPSPINFSPTGGKLPPVEKKDMVNHPPHYKGENGIECIDAMEAAFGKEEVSIFCKCNAFKYLFRNRIKQQGESIQKAAWYIDKYKQLVEEELWITCVENDAYEVSSKGNVRLKGSDTNRTPVFVKNGYATILTTNMGKPILYYVHRLVANAFIPNPDNLPQVNHKDHNRANNKVDNLEWCSAKYNTQDAKGSTVYAYDEDKNLIAKFNSLRDAEDYFNIAHSSIKRYWIDTNKMCGNVFFYSHSLIDDTQNKVDMDMQKEIQDLEKAIWYIKDRINQLKGGTSCT